MQPTLIRVVLVAILPALAPFSGCAQQAPASPVPKPAPASQQAPTAAQAPATTLRLTLEDALNLASKNSTQCHAALTEAGIAREDRVQARDALLPGVDFTTSVLYTQPNNIGGIKYIPNNAPHEYVSQGKVHQQPGLAAVASYRSTAALAAAAKARAEVASRGLVVTVVENYFAVGAADEKLTTAKRTAEEGERFLQITRDLEKGGEVAHSDVIKAELQAQDRRRQLKEAQLALLNARLDLAVLIFPDFNENFELTDDLHAPAQLPTLGEVQQQAAQNNPDVRAALETVRAAGFDLTGARAGYLPSLSFD